MKPGYSMGVLSDMDMTFKPRTASQVAVILCIVAMLTVSTAGMAEARADKEEEAGAPDPRILAGVARMRKSIR